MKNKTNMEKQNKPPHRYVFFLIAGLAILCLFSLAIYYIFLNIYLNQDNSATSANSNRSSGSELDYDPLITVVPQK